MSDLKSQLIHCAELWAAAHDPEAPLSRLGKRVAGDAKFFERIASGGGGLNLATLERFARFYIEPDNWPSGAIPAEAYALAHATGVRGSSPESDVA